MKEGAWRWERWGFWVGTSGSEPLVWKYFVLPLLVAVACEGSELIRGHWLPIWLPVYQMWTRFLRRYSH